MSLDIHLTMDDTALAPFRAAWNRASDGSHRLPELTAAARAHYAELDHGRVPPYLHEHVRLIPEIADLLADDDWQLDAAVRDELAGALSYFNDPADLIPDARPNFGLLDDAIVIELALDKNRREWAAWQEYATMRHCLPDLGPMSRQRWNELRRDLPRLLRTVRSERSYLCSPFGWNDGRSDYRLLGDLPRFDMQ